MREITAKADMFGMVASALCFIHCAATPFIFLTKACTTTCCADAPVWWLLIDYFFLVISFIAIYYSTKNSSVRWIKKALWTTWVILMLVILHDSLGLGLFGDAFIYFPAFALIFLHFYNQKYCKCGNIACKQINLFHKES